MGAVPLLCGHGDRSLKGLGGGRCLRALQGNPQAHAAETFSFSLWGVGEHVTLTPGARKHGCITRNHMALHQEGDSSRRRHDEKRCCLGPKPWPSTRLHSHAMMHTSAVNQEKTKFNYCQAPGCSCTLDLRETSADMSLIWSCL